MRAIILGRAKSAGGAAVALVLAACAPSGEVASTPAGEGHAAQQSAHAGLPAGAPLPTGASIAQMAGQYARPHLGAVPAAGASSWVAPAPAPAFVISTPLPPGDPPAPLPAAVANRQPDPRPTPAVPAAGVVRPQAAAPVVPAAPAAVAAVDLAKGRQLFANYGCGGCHTLADGGGTGGIGPSLDGNPRLTGDYVSGAIGEGRGTMPAFRDQLSADEIATLAAYIVQASRK